MDRDVKIICNMCQGTGLNLNFYFKQCYKCSGKGFMWASIFHDKREAI